MTPRTRAPRAAILSSTPTQMQPILITRIRAVLPGPGPYQAETGKGKSKGLGKGLNPWPYNIIRQTLPPYHKIGSPHMCAHARAAVHGCLSICGKVVRDKDKYLIPKGNSPYFCPLPSPYQGCSSW